MIIRFYAGQCPDSEGRMIDDILSWDYDRLEYMHDYIHWLFPLNEESWINPDAPVLNDIQIQEFHRNKQLKSQLVESFKIILGFYGFEYKQQKRSIIIDKSDDWNARKSVWLSRGNHNFLRITRILKSMRILGLQKQALAFYFVLKEIYQTDEGTVIGAGTFEYWTDAAGYYESDV